MDHASLRKNGEFFEHRSLGADRDGFSAATNDPTRAMYGEGFTGVNRKDLRIEAFKTPKRKKKESYKEVVDEFAHNTNLLGILHILKRRNLFWTLAYMLCLGMSIFQTWSVTFDFIEQRTKQSFSVENANDLPFPSVTICNGVVLPLSFNRSKIPGYDTSVAGRLNSSTCASPTAMDEWADRAEANHRLIVKYRRSLTESQRMHLSGPVPSFIAKCKFGDTDCRNFSDSDKFFVFNNPFYGTCATFNPAFHKETAITEDVGTKLRMQVLFHSTELRLDSVRPKVVVRIHVPGTAPVLDSTLLSDVYPGITTAFKVKVNMRFFMPRKGDPMGCINYRDLKYRKKSIYYSKYSPYLYSVKNCMKSCEQAHLLMRCNVTDASSPVAYDDKERIHQSNQCEIQSHETPCILPEDLDMKFCQCPLPCKYLRYQVTSNTNDYLAPCHTGNQERLQKAYIVVYLDGNIYEKVEEELLVNLYSYLGILGGNMSLWIGICVISVLELFELTANLSAVRYRKGKSTQPTEMDKYATARSIPNPAFVIPPTFSQKRKLRTSRKVLWP